MTTKRPKAKRALSNINFEQEGAHVALVSKEQGGGANGHNYALVMKAASPEFVQKMQQIQVTMELPDFLEKFFYIWGEDAKALAYMMGYVEPADTQAMENEEAKTDFEKWMEDRFSAFTVVKSLKQAENLEKALLMVNEQDALAVREFQFAFEKALEQKNSAESADEGSTEAVAKAKVSDDETNAVVEPSGATNSGTNMDEKEMVEKSALESVQKALDDTRAELTKALETLAAIEAEKVEAIRKSKLEALKAVLKNEKQVEAIAKAALTLDGDEFTAFTDTIGELVKAAEGSNLFQEHSG